MQCMVCEGVCLSVLCPGGVPGAPNASRADSTSILMWSAPSSNGDPITQYTIIATYVFECVYVCVSAHVCIMYMCVCTCVCTCTYVCARTHMHVCA